MPITKTRDLITPSLGRISQQLKSVPKEAHDFWVKQTPKKTGNARRKTKLRGNTITADYPYAQPLDKGSSKQAPKGMSEPTLEFVERLLRKKIRK